MLASTHLNSADSAILQGLDSEQDFDSDFDDVFVFCGALLVDLDEAFLFSFSFLSMSTTSSLFFIAPAMLTVSSILSHFPTFVFITSLKLTRVLATRYTPSRLTLQSPEFDFSSMSFIFMSVTLQHCTTSLAWCSAD